MMVVGWFGQSQSHLIRAHSRSHDDAKYAELQYLMMLLLTLTVAYFVMNIGTEIYFFLF